VQLDRLAVALRLRNPWESMDLGFAMVRAWLRSVYGAWLALFLPACVLSLVLLPPQWAGLLVWWLKPLFDRVVLHVVSNGVFGDLPTLRQTLRALRSALHPGLFLSLTLYRLDLARSFNLPVWQLERQSGRAARMRARQLHRRTRGYAVWLTVACLHFEAIVWLSSIALYDLLAPAAMATDAGFLSLFSLEQPGKLHEYLFVAVYFLSVTLVEPFYVAGGFALYLTRRTALEGWDLEVQLRRIGERLQGAQRPLAANLLLGAALVLGLALAGTPPARAQEARALRLAPDSRAVQEVKSVLARPEFQEYEERTVLQYLGDRKEPQRPNANLGINWFETIGIGLSDLLRALAWVLLGIAVAFLLYLVARRLDLWGLWSRGSRSEYRPPDSVFGLEVRPETLPEDIGAAALGLARAGQLLGALSLLYRGVLATLLHRDGLELAGGDTEEDCLQKSASRIALPAHAYFARLLLAWQRLAYARRTVPMDEVEQLCADWAAHFQR
jgi:hypothetical protein